ncbi:MAG TPA: glycosyltransferase family 4 protein [Planctomycetota bacterium]|nr:glycosyltransferase family 4 protein [Planctomycetota bacterium]
MSVLLIEPPAADWAERAIRSVRERFPGETLTLVTKAAPGAVARLAPPGVGEVVARRAEGFPGLGAVRAWLGLAVRRHAAVVVPFPGRPQAPAPLLRLLVFSLLPRTRMWILREDGGVERMGTISWVREGFRAAGFRILDGAARLLARAIALLAGPRKRIPPTSPREESRAAYVLPLLPDLSHTFVYREVLAILDRDPDAEVLCLERGTAPFLHPEAAPLLGKVRFVRRPGIAARYASLFGWMVRSPLRTGALFGLYGRRPGGSPGDLLGRTPFCEPRHPGNAFHLADALRGRRVGHLHAYGSTYCANVALGASLLLDRPFSVTAYEDFDFDYDFKMLPEKFARASFLRVTTRDSRARLARQLGLERPERIPVIPWGIDPARWGGEARRPGRGTLLSACRLVEKKGLRHLVPALARLVERGVPFRWIAAGDGPERASLEALVARHGLEGRVEFLGPVPSDRVRELLLRSDLAVLPCVVAADGDRDGIPTFLLEAMLCGVPVVTTPVSGIPELVVDGETGFLARPGEPDSLAETIERALRDRALADRVAARARKRVETTQRVERSAELLLQAVGGRVPGP